MNKSGLQLRRAGSPAKSSFYTTSASRLRSSSLSQQHQDLEEMTKSLQIEKRRYLQSEEQLKKMVVQFSETQNHFYETKKKAEEQIQNRTIAIKTANLMNHSNKIYTDNQKVQARIRQVHNDIVVIRKESNKNKSMVSRLNEDIKCMESDIKGLDQKIDQAKSNNQFIKSQILFFRNKTIEDIKDFKTTFVTLSHSYLGDKKKQEEKDKNMLLELGSQTQLQVNALPLLKHRLRNIITRNRERMRIAHQYKRTCGEVRKMFQLMCEYKGKQDLHYVAKEFVQKENNIYKLQEYISQLELKIENIKQQQREVFNKVQTSQSEIAIVDDSQKYKDEKRQQCQALTDKIRVIDGKIQAKQKFFDSVALHFQKVLVKLRGSKQWNLDGDKPEQISINFTLLGNNIQKVLGEVEKYISYAKPQKGSTGSGSAVPSSAKKLNFNAKQRSGEKVHHQSSEQQDRINSMNNPHNAHAPTMSSQQEKQYRNSSEFMDYRKLREAATEYVLKKSQVFDLPKKRN